MFLTLLGGSLALGAGLLAAAGYSEGTLLAARTAALTIGWLFLLATLIGVQRMRRARLAERCATTIVFLSGVGVLYLSYFHWSELPDVSVQLAVADVLPEQEVDIQLVAPEPLATSAAFVSLPPVARVATPKPAAEPRLPSVQKPSPPKEEPAPKEERGNRCSSLSGVEALRCKRCGDKRGLSWVACQESARLEYCAGRHGDDAACPSAIPAAYPG
jgi:hypothetical protein